MTDKVPSRRGRPSVVRGEESIEVGVTIEVSLHRQLRLIAQRQREEFRDVVRAALREFVAEKLTVARP